MLSSRCNFRTPSPSRSRGGFQFIHFSQLSISRNGSSRLRGVVSCTCSQSTRQLLGNCDPLEAGRPSQSSTPCRWLSTTFRKSLFSSRAHRQTTFAVYGHGEQHDHSYQQQQHCQCWSFILERWRRPTREFLCKKKNITVLLCVTHGLLRGRQSRRTRRPDQTAF